MIDRKITVIPTYGGASKMGWSPQYVGTLLEKLADCVGDRPKFLISL